MEMFSVMLGLGDVASSLGRIVESENQSNNRGSHITVGSNSRSHPGIYSSHASDGKVKRTHYGIYCNPALKQPKLPPVSESQSYDSETGSSGDVHSWPASPQCASDCESEIDDPPPTSRLMSRMMSDCGSEIDSPPPTSRLMLPNQTFNQSSKETLTSKYLLSFDDFNCQGRSPCTPKQLMQTAEQFGPPKLGSPSVMVPQTHKPDEAMSGKISAGCGYLLPLTVKNVSIASNKTSSTCSDLDTSGSDLDTSGTWTPPAAPTPPTGSLNLSSASEQQNPESLCCDENTQGLKRIPLRASPIDQSEASSAKPVKMSPHSFCRQAFAECDLDNLKEEMMDVSKDLEALQASMASSKRVLFERCS